MMSRKGMERTMIFRATLLSLNKRTAVRQRVGHVQGDHPEENGDEDDGRNENNEPSSVQHLKPQLT